MLASVAEIHAARAEAVDDGKVARKLVVEDVTEIAYRYVLVEVVATRTKDDTDRSSEP